MQADPEQLPAFPSVRRDQGGIKMTGKRAPWLNTRQDHSAATIGCFQPVRGPSAANTPQVPSGTGAPDSARMASASLCASRTLATVRFRSLTAASTAQRDAVPPRPGSGSRLP